MNDSALKHETLISELMAHRAEHRFPPQIRTLTKRFAGEILSVLFPHFTDHIGDDPHHLDIEIQQVEATLQEILGSLSEAYQVPNEGLIDSFIQCLPSIYQALLLDAKAIYHGDPAAISVEEVILSYPGFFAIALHRVAHDLYRLGLPLMPRLLSEHAHHHTGIDIHPGATIGRSFFIDHGTGIVVGETAVIGNGVKLYQGVTLGALVVQKHLANRKRHPTLGDNVVVYANATILGGETEVGHDSFVGGNAWVTESIPPFSIVGRNSDVRPRKIGVEPDIEFNI